MCQRETAEISLLCIKKQLEELWQNTEFLIRLLSNNCQRTREALKPIVNVDQRSGSELPDPAILSEQFEEKLCEKIDQVVRYAHSVVEKSKECLLTEDGRTKKKSVESVVSTGKLQKHVNIHDVPKTKFPDKKSKLACQSRADFLKTTYGSAFAKPKNHTKDKSNKFTRLCSTKNVGNCVESNAKSNSVTKSDPFIFNDIDDLLDRAVACPKSSRQEDFSTTGIDTVQEKLQMETVRTFFKVDEAIKMRLIESHKEFINLISSYHKILARLNTTHQNESSHRSRFLEELERKNQSYAMIYKDRDIELQRCFSMIEKCPIYTYDLHTQTSVPCIPSHKSTGNLLLTYNNPINWIKLETKKCELYFWQQHAQLLKTIETNISHLTPIEDKALLSKTLTSLTSMLSSRNVR